MKTRASRMENCGWPAPSDLECGGPLPVLAYANSLVPSQSARRLAQSKTWRNIVASLALFSIALGACAQNYSIDWFKTAAGGGTSTNGQYSVSGTTGQQDAGGAMSGGKYSLTGGFWSLIAAVQTPGAPLLTVTHSGNSVMVSWPYPSSGFVLQQDTNLSTTNWTASAFTITTNSSINSVTITPPVGNLFLRLYHP